MPKYAAIDIGSNAVRILFAQVVEKEDDVPSFIKLSLIRLPIRLGADSFLSGNISKENENKLGHMLNAFKSLYEVYDIEDYYATATSAMRDAKNGQEIIKRLQKQSGITINIISGQEEATILFEGIYNTGKLDFKKNYMLIDVGGGSTEIIFFVKGKQMNSSSFNLGAIRLKEKLQDDKEWEQFYSWISKNAKKYQPDYAIGTGGNINEIYKQCSLKSWEMLSVKKLDKKLQLLKQFKPTELIKQFNMKSDRADVITYGGKIYLKAMHKSNLHKMIVPKVGLSDGLIRRIYLAHKHKNSDKPKQKSHR